MRHNAIVFGTCLLLSLTRLAASQDSPYAGQQERSIKALSSDEVRSYLAGEGMGFAKAAELNHYPGPKHVLAMAAELKLSPEQEKRAREIFARMQREAADLGQRIVDKERELDRAFAGNHAEEAAVSSLALEIGGLLGGLRHAHLRAHLEMRAILSRAQVETYDRLRGYGAEHQHKGKHH
ncbi:MAG: periplasmic heavy metal sensor [Acidobacteria bacterium]|nr:periplasmic heavy metal sensor [Acidobacteriota bacterium]